ALTRTRLAARGGAALTGRRGVLRLTVGPLTVGPLTVGPLTVGPLTGLRLGVLPARPRRLTGILARPGAVLTGAGLALGRAALRSALRGGTALRTAETALLLGLFVRLAGRVVPALRSGLGRAGPGSRPRRDRGRCDPLGHTVVLVPVIRLIRSGQWESLDP